MCQAIKGRDRVRPNSDPLCIYFDERNIWDASSFMPRLRRQAAHPTVSLKYLIEQGLLNEGNRGGAFSRNDKAVLALSLARCMLHLFKGAWMQQTWNSETLQFPQSITDEIVLDIHSPYVNCSFSEPLRSNTQNLDLADVYSVVLSFAKMLLEIEIGEVIIVEDFDLPSPKDNLRETLFGILEQRQDEFARENFNDAVEGCLKFDQTLRLTCDDIEDCEDDVVGIARLVRKCLYEGIIVHLEDNMKHIPNLKESVAPRDIYLYQRTAKHSSGMYSNSRSRGILSTEGFAEATQAHESLTSRPDTISRNFVTLMGDIEQSASQVNAR